MDFDLVRIVEWDAWFKGRMAHVRKTIETGQLSVGEEIEALRGLGALMRELNKLRRVAREERADMRMRERESARRERPFVVNAKLSMQDPPEPS